MAIPFHVQRQHYYVPAFVHIVLKTDNTSNDACLLFEDCMKRLI